jgi:hypothetical protein
MELQRTDARTGTENPFENQAQPATTDFTPRGNPASSPTEDLK